MPDRFATGASAIRPTPDAQLSRFHWDKLANSGGKRSFAQAAWREAGHSQHQETARRQAAKPVTLDSRARQELWVRPETAVTRIAPSTKPTRSSAHVWGR